MKILYFFLLLFCYSLAISADRTEDNKTIFLCKCKGIEETVGLRYLLLPNCSTGGHSGDEVCVSGLKAVRGYIPNESRTTSTNNCRTGGAYSPDAGWECRNQTYCKDPAPCTPTIFSL